MPDGVLLEVPRRPDGSVLVCGAINIDIMGVVSDFCPPGGAVTVGETMVTLGGHAANCAAVAARLGLGVELSGAVGNDANGELAMSALANEGVGVDAVSRSDEATGLVFVPVLSATGERGLYLMPGANRRWRPPAAHVVARCPCAVVFDPPAHALSYFARQYPGRWAFAPGSLIESVDLRQHLAAIRSCSVFIVNMHEAGELTRALTPEEAARRLHHELGCPTVVTAGEHGFWLVDGHEVTRQPAFAMTEVVDSTGAGDALVAGLAWAYSLREVGRPALRRAAAVAALVVRGLGASTCAPTPEEVAELMRAGAPAPESDFSRPAPWAVPMPTAEPAGLPRASPARLAASGQKAPRTTGRGKEDSA